MLLVVDGNNLAWAGFYAVGRSMGVETPAEKVRAALIGLCGSALGLLARGAEPPQGPGQPGAVTRVAFAFDHGRPLRRRQLFPAYQTGREATGGFLENEPFVLEAIAAFIEIVRSAPCVVLRGENTEADDLAGALAIGTPGRVRIASSDRDFLQLVDERVSVYSPIKRVVVKPGNFTTEACPKDSKGTVAEFPRERYLDYRVASGDSSDDLPGIAGVGALTAARLVARHPLDAYLDDVGLVTQVLGRRNVKIEGAIRSGEARAVVERNRALMDLRRAAGEYPDLGPYTTSGEWEEAAFRGHLAALRLPMLDTEAVCRSFALIAEA